MPYLSDKRKKKQYWNILLGAFAFALFLYYWNPFKGVVYPLLEPLVRGYSVTKVASTILPSFVSTYFTTHKELYGRTILLEKEIERLENNVAEKDAQIRELELSKLGALGDVAGPLVMYPLVEDVTRLYSTLILSKGYKDGIQSGSLVYVRGQQVVCEIIQVYDRTSLCELLSKGGRRTEAVTASSSAVLTLVGEGGGDFIADLPKGVGVVEGEEVYLRSNQAFHLGTIVAMRDDEQATGVRVYVRGAYNPSSSSVFYLNTSYAH